MVRAEHQPVDRHLPDPAGRVEARQRGHGELVAGLGEVEQAPDLAPVLRPDRHQEGGGDHRGEHRPQGPRHHQGAGRVPVRLEGAGAEVDTRGGGSFGEWSHRPARRLALQPLGRSGRGEHGGQEGSGEQRVAGLLEEDRELEETEPLTAELLGEMDARPPLLGQLLPHRLELLGLGVEQRTRHARRAVRREPPGGDAALFLVLFGQGDRHRNPQARSPAGSSTTSTEMARIGHPSAATRMRSSSSPGGSRTIDWPSSSRSKVCGRPVDAVAGPDALVPVDDDPEHAPLPPGHQIGLAHMGLAQLTLAHLAVRVAGQLVDDLPLARAPCTWRASRRRDRRAPRSSPSPATAPSPSTARRPARREFRRPRSRPPPGGRRAPLRSRAARCSRRPTTPCPKLGR